MEKKNSKTLIAKLASLFDYSWENGPHVMKKTWYQNDMEYERYYMESKRQQAYILLKYY